jgi:hypothetical protein
MRTPSNFIALFVCIAVAVTLASAADSSARAVAVCENDAAFRSDVSRPIYAAGDYALQVRAALEWTHRHSYEFVWKPYWPGAWPNGRAGKQPPSPQPLVLGKPCSLSLAPARVKAIQGYGHLAAFLRLFALFPSDRAAPRAQWLGVIRQAELSDRAFLAAARAVDSPRRTAIATDLSLLAAFRGGSLP